MLAQVQSSQQAVIGLRKGSPVGLTLMASTSDGAAYFMEYLDERKWSYSPEYGS